MSYRWICIVAAVAFFLSVSTASAATEITSNITNGTVWNAVESPYLINSDIWVNPNATLTIEPGTEVQYAEGARLRLVNGAKIIAHGTADTPIVFTVPEPLPQENVAPMNMLSIPPEISEDSPSDVENQNVGVGLPSEDMSQEEVIPVELMSDTMYDSGIYFDGVNSIYGTAATSGEFSYVRFEGTEYGIFAGRNAAVNITHASFSGITQFPIYAGDAIVSVTDSSFSDGPIAGFVGGGTFTHSENTFTTTIPGWQYALSVGVGQTITLESTDGAYHLSSMHVPRTATVRIAPGVKIVDTQASDAGLFDVQGSLVVEGTAEHPVEIYGLGVCTTHRPVIRAYRWPGYTPPFSPAVSLSYAVFRDLCGGIVAPSGFGAITLEQVAFENIAAAVVDIQLTALTANAVTMNNVYQGFTIGSMASANISRTTIDGSNGPDAAVYTNNGTLTVINSSIMNAVGAAIGCVEYAICSVSNSSMQSNAFGAVVLNAPDTNLANNWWGSASGPTIESSPGGTGQSIVATNSPGLIYTPWLTAAPTGVGAPVYSPRDPVIIVPGITGTQLFRNSDEVWPNVLGALFDSFDLHINEMKLLPDGTENPDKHIFTGDIIRSAYGTDIFETLITDLEENGYIEGVDLFVFPYDWRFGNELNANKLKVRVDSILSLTNKNKIDVIAHSMGGILTKTYISQNNDNKIDQLFFIGTPHLGTAETLKILLYGDDMSYKFLGKPFLQSLQVKYLSQTLPSIFELLPSEKFIDLHGMGYLTDHVLDKTKPALSFQDTKKWLIDKGENRNYIGAADSLHQVIDNLNLGEIKAYNFAGCGRSKTIAGIEILRNKNISIGELVITPSYKLIYTNGDQTVPIKSATSGNVIKNYYINNALHARLPSVEKVRNSLISLLNNLEPDTNLTNDTVCNISGKAIEIHSPVSLHIYDEDGNHVGPLPDGTIEYGIEGVSYEVIDHEKFAFLPEGREYRIVHKAEDVGTYDYVVSDIADDNSVSNERYFTDVPITSMNMSAQSIIDDDMTDYTLQIDQDGNGQYEVLLASADTPDAPESDSEGSRRSSRKQLDIELELVPIVPAPLTKNIVLNQTPLVRRIGKVSPKNNTVVQKQEQDPAQTIILPETPPSRQKPLAVWIGAGILGLGGAFVMRKLFIR